MVFCRNNYEFFVSMIAVTIPHHLGSPISLSTLMEHVSPRAATLGSRYGPVSTPVCLKFVYPRVDMFVTNIAAWEVVRKLGPPQRFQENSHTPIEVTGLHWLDPKQNRLIVVYKSHGVQCVLLCPSFVVLLSVLFEGCGMSLPERSSQVSSRRLQQCTSDLNE